MVKVYCNNQWMDLPVNGKQVTESFRNNISITPYEVLELTDSEREFYRRCSKVFRSRADK